MIGIHKGFQEGERCDHEIKVHFYTGHPVTVESGFKQAENGARKVVRKKSDHYRREMDGGTRNGGEAQSLIQFIDNLLCTWHCAKHLHTLSCGVCQ